MDRGLVFALALMLVLSASPVSLGVAEQTSSPEMPSGLKTGDPLKHGVTETELDTLRAILKRAVETGEVPAVSLLLAHKGEIIFKEAYGYADIAAKRPFTADDTVWLASSSKPVSATCVMILAERGKLSLDAPLDQYLPEFKGIKVRGQSQPAKQPTTRQLLSHTSGIIPASAWAVFAKPAGPPDEPSLPSPSADYDRDVLARAMTHTLAEAVALTAEYDLVAEPGTVFGYSGVGFSVAGRVAEVVDGKPFDEIMKTELLDPLGMSHTTFKPSAETVATIPTKYAKTASGLQPAPPMPVTESSRLIIPSGGLVSTLDDMAAFLHMHLNRGTYAGKRILSEQSVAEMQKDETRGLKGIPQGTSYGLGWFIDRRSDNGQALTISHGGLFGTMAWIDLDRDVIGVLFTQVQPPTPAARQATREIRDKVRTIFPSN